MNNRRFTIHPMGVLVVLLCTACGSPAAPLDPGGPETLPTPSSTTGGGSGLTGPTSGTLTGNANNTANPNNPNSSGSSGTYTPLAGAKILAQGGPGLCLDVVAGGMAAGTVVQLWGCNDFAAAQAWQLTSTGQVRTTNNRCLDVAGTVQAGAQLVIMPCDTTYTDSQQWFFVNGTMQIIQDQNALCASPASGQMTQGTPVRLADCLKGLVNEEWSIGYNDGTATHGISVASGNDTFHSCLAAPSATPKAGQSITLGTCGGAGTIQWMALSNSNGTELTVGGMCATASTAAVGGTLSFGACNAAATQQWELEQGAIRLANTDLCLEVTPSGVDLDLCDVPSPNQIWGWAPF